MKKIILTIFCFGMLFPLLGSAARPYGVEEIPNVQVGNRYRFTSNPDGVLSPSAVAEIDSLCYSLRHRALAQVAVVAVEDIRGDDLFSFAHTLFSQWGVGRADSDNGLGILLVVDRREVRFVTGPGLEGVLPDALCKRIQMRYMLPYFREGDYSAGMVAGLRAVASVLEGSELDLGGNDDFRATDDLPAWAVFLIVFLVVFVPLGVMLVGRQLRFVIGLDPLQGKVSELIHHRTEFTRINRRIIDLDIGCEAIRVIPEALGIFNIERNGEKQEIVIVKRADHTFHTYVLTVSGHPDKIDLNIKAAQTVDDHFARRSSQIGRAHV